MERQHEENCSYWTEVNCILTELNNVFAEHEVCVESGFLYLQEVFDLRVVVRFLLNQRGSVQLARTESEGRKHSR